MARACGIAFAGILAALATLLSHAQDPAAPKARAVEGLTGTWKLTHWTPAEQDTYWYVTLESKDGKWTGQAVSLNEEVPATTLSNLKIGDGKLGFTLRLQGGPRLPFEGKLPAGDAKKISGSLLFGPRLVPAQLELLTPKVVPDVLEFSKEVVAGPNPGPEAISAALLLIRQAGKVKAKPEEVRSWAEKALKAAEPHGPRLQRDAIIKIATALANQEAYAAVALEYARRAERLLEAKDRPMIQKQVLDILAEALRKAGKLDEAKEIETRSSKIEPIRPVPFAGRQAKSDRVVLVELFTGAQCPPCVAADLAFDALQTTYKPTEVVCLQYHEHIPGADPLTNADSEARLRYYLGEEGSTPNILFNGKLDAEGGGGRFNAQDKYEEYQAVIDPLLETPARAKIKATATRKDSKIEIAAEATDITEKGDNVRKLRLALVEDVVNYTGGNRLPTHHCVVRSFPGGVEGVTVKDKAARQSVTVDLDEVRKSLNKYLDEVAKEAPFPNKERPMEFKKLRVVAFVQDEATKEVLQALQVEVGEQKK